MKRTRRLNGHELAKGLLELSQALTSGDSIDDRMAVLCGKTAQLLGCDRSSLFVWQDGCYRARYNHGNPADVARRFLDHRVSERDPLVAEAFRRNSFVVVNDTSVSPLMNQETAVRARIRAIVVAPLLEPEGRPLGFLTAEYNENPGDFDETKSMLVLGIAKLAESAIFVERRQRRHEAEMASAHSEMERFVYTVSHDLKSPLITIGGNLGFLERSIARRDLERAPDSLSRIGNAVANMGQLLDDLLRLSRVGRVADRPQQIEMVKICENVLETVSGGIEKRGASVVVAADLPSACADPRRIEEVVQNLLENALKFLGDQPQPRIEIGWRADESETVYTVRDNGIGVDPAYQEKIFGLFERLETGTEGTGVGLALVRRIVDSQSGRIWVESEGDGCGSTFCFTLPAVE